VIDFAQDVSRVFEVQMRKLLIVAAIVLAASSSACAKLRVAVNVEVSDEKVKRELQEAMEARINSTERYTISSNAVETDLLLGVNCLVLERGEGYRTGVACDSDVTYYPYKDSALSITLDAAGSMAASRVDDTSHVANSLMNHFINGTTDGILADRKNFLRAAIRAFCANEPTECKMTRP
jgi:hypothetical protein